MEAHDTSQLSSTGRLRRPESSLSSHSRFTPQSSNSSSANLTYRDLSARSDRERGHDTERGATLESSTGSLLQERLREKKAIRQSERQIAMETDTKSTDRAVAQSSPITNRVSRDQETYDVRRPSSSGKLSGSRTVSRKGMGVKEMEETVSSLHKLNFDLKLELFHRREKQTTLEKRIEALEAQLAEQAEMQAVNEQLVAELEKRDQAVEEAVGMICSLEEKVDRLMHERQIVTSFDQNYGKPFFHNNHISDDNSSPDPRSSPPPPHGQDSPPPSKPFKFGSRSSAMVRMPSFLSEHSEGVDALRSLYLPSDHDGQNFLTLPKLPEEGSKVGVSEAGGMDSPRLSVLSESSFLSVYGDKALASEALDLDDASQATSLGMQRHARSVSVEKWIDGKPRAASPLPGDTESKGHSTQNKFLSINDVLESPLQRLEKLERTLSKHNKGLASARLKHELASVEQLGTHRQPEKEHNPPIRRTEVAAFEGRHSLPPTPDTISTSTLRLYKTSNDTLSREASDRQKVSNMTSTEPSQLRPFARRSLSARPFSAGETITSQREGHGWDTVTTTEYSDTDSDGGEEETIADPWIATTREKFRPSVEPPNMFTFDRGDDDIWGSDVLFNRSDPQRLPVRKRREFDTDPNSDDTITMSPRRSRAASFYDKETWYPPAAPIDISTRPDPPQRRSSLAASPGGNGTFHSKIRKSHGLPPSSSTRSNSTSASGNGGRDAGFSKQKPATTSRRSRITNKVFGGLGNRNDESPKEPSITQSATSNNYNHTATHQNRRRSMDLSVEALHASSATPPPISRWRKDPSSARAGGEQGRHEVVGDTVRPTSSGQAEISRPPVVEILPRMAKKEKRSSWGRAFESNKGWGGADASGEADAEQDGVMANDGSGKKKWFGLGRNGSLHR